MLLRSVAEDLTRGQHAVGAGIVGAYFEVTCDMKSLVVQFG